MIFKTNNYCHIKTTHCAELPIQLHKAVAYLETFFWEGGVIPNS
jgi:hypothetical protein